MSEITALIMLDRFEEAHVKINELSNEKRREVRAELEASNLPLPRNLYFNYQTQEWI